jgi:hypothetical protein
MGFVKIAAIISSQQCNNKLPGILLTEACRMVKSKRLLVASVTRLQNRSRLQHTPDMYKNIHEQNGKQEFRKDRGKRGEVKAKVELRDNGGEKDK